MLGEVNYSYNDSIYERVDDTTVAYTKLRGVSPIKLFKTAASADRAAAILTSRLLRGENTYHHSFSHYFYNIRDVIQDKEAFFLILKKFNFSRKKYDSALDPQDRNYDKAEELSSFVDKIIPKLSEEDLITLIHATSVRFFIVQPVEVADSVDLLTSSQEWERDLGKKLYEKI